MDSRVRLAQPQDAEAIMRFVQTVKPEAFRAIPKNEYNWLFHWQDGRAILVAKNASGEVVGCAAMVRFVAPWKVTHVNVAVIDHGDPNVRLKLLAECLVFAKSHWGTTQLALTE